MAVKKTSTDKTPIEKAIDAAVAPVEEKKAPAKKAAPKKETKAVAEKKEVKAEAAPVAEKKAPVKKAPAKKATTKKEMKSVIAVQFSGKSYTQDDLMKIAKDVWRFDLKKKAADLVSVELYVKPEESMVYYVFNGTECGSFAI